MKDVLKPLLENELLNDDAKEQIQEAFEAHVKNLKEEMESNIREEFANRYEHDKGNLVKAVERMVEEALTAELSEFQTDRKELAEARVKLAKELREARIERKTKLAEQSEAVTTFVAEAVKKELGEFQADRKQVQEAKRELAEERTRLAEEFKTKLAEQVKTMEGFVLENLKKEVSEFQADKKALVEQRVKMISEGRKKLNETRKEFIRRSSNLVEATVEKTLQKELTQLHEDIERSRRNTFGAQLFEAFATEFESSFFNENKIVKGLKSQLEEANSKVAKAAELFEHSQRLARESEKKIKLAEARAERATVMNDLLGKLSGKQRDVMAELLEGVKTQNLRESFKKYIPAVTNGNGSTVLGRKTTGGKTLVEGSRKVVTGDKTNKLMESDRANEASHEGDIIELKKLAGI